MKSVRQALRNASTDNGYASPEWKAFASLVRKTKGNFCESCKQGNLPTQVHHLFYEHGRKLWDYGMDEVVVLCPGCHTALHQELQAFRKAVFGNLNPTSFRVLNGALTIALREYQPLVFAHALAEFVVSPGMVQRFADAWGCSARKASPLSDLPQGERAKAILAQVKQ